MKNKRIDFTIRESTIKALREHAKKTGHSMSLIVDLAIELYIREYKKLEFMKGR